LYCKNRRINENGMARTRKEKAQIRAISFDLKLMSLIKVFSITFTTLKANKPKIIIEVIKIKVCIKKV
jgi:hypothetical protein